MKFSVERRLRAAAAPTTTKPNKDTKQSQWQSSKPAVKVKKWIGQAVTRGTRRRFNDGDDHGNDDVEKSFSSSPSGGSPSHTSKETRQSREGKIKLTIPSPPRRPATAKKEDGDRNGTGPSTSRRWWKRSPSSSSSSSSSPFPHMLARSTSNDAGGAGGEGNSTGNTSGEQTQISDDEECDRSVSSSSVVANDPHHRHHHDIVLGPIFPSSFVGEQHRHYPHHDEIDLQRENLDYDNFDENIRNEKENASGLSAEEFRSSEVHRKLDRRLHDTRKSASSTLDDDNRRNQHSLDVQHIKIDNRGINKPFQFDKAEIISMLFPLGYPTRSHIRAAADTTEQPKENRNSVVPTASSEIVQSGVGKGTEAKIVNVILQNEQRETAGSLDGSFESLLRDASALDISVGTTSDGTSDQGSNNGQDEGNRRQETWRQQGNVVLHQEKDQEDGRKKGPHHGVTPSDIIGKTISFDPTWDLLETEPANCTVTTRRSRLQRLQEIEQYADSLLEKFQDDDPGVSDGSSTDDDISIDRLLHIVDYCDDPIYLHSCKMAGNLSSQCELFELGWHFDPVQYPSIHFGYDEEYEIVFTSDDPSRVNFTTNKAGEHSSIGLKFGGGYEDIRENSIRESTLTHEEKEALDFPSESDEYPIDLPDEWMTPLSPINSDTGSALSALNMSLPIPSIPSGSIHVAEEGQSSFSSAAGRDVFDMFDDESDSIPSCYCSKDSNESY